MHRMRCAIVTAFVCGVISGCGEEQPNHAAAPSEVTPDFAAKSADMMRAANTGMDKKKAAPVAPGQAK